MDRAPRNQKGNGLRMYGPGYRGGCQKGVEGVDTLQAAEPPYSVSNGPIKTNSENIGKWRMIYKIGHRISILLNVQRKQKKGVDSKVIRTRRIVKLGIHTKTTLLQNKIESPKN